MDPFTIAMALGTGINMFGNIFGGSQERKAAEYNAELMERRARAIASSAYVEQEAMTESAREAKASQRAAYAKSGAVPTSGTPLLVMAEQAGKMQKDIMEQRRNRLVQEQQALSQAAMLRYQGKQSSLAGMIGAGSSLLGGIGKMGG